MLLLGQKPGNSPAGNQDEMQKENTPPGQDQVLSCLATWGRGMERGYDQTQPHHHAHIEKNKMLCKRPKSYTLLVPTGAHYQMTAMTSTSIQESSVILASLWTVPLTGDVTRNRLTFSLFCMSLTSQHF